MEAVFSSCHCLFSSLLNIQILIFSTVFGIKAFNKSVANPNFEIYASEKIEKRACIKSDLR